jgi:hypothetical protein
MRKNVREPTERRCPNEQRARELVLDLWHLVNLELLEPTRTVFKLPVPRGPGPMRPRPSRQLEVRETRRSENHVSGHSDCSTFPA